MREKIILNKYIMENLDNVHYLYLKDSDKIIENINGKDCLKYKLPDLTLFGSKFVYIQIYHIKLSNHEANLFGFKLITKSFNCFDEETPLFLTINDYQNIPTNFKILSTEKFIIFDLVRRNNIRDNYYNFKIKITIPEDKNTNNRKNNRRNSSTSRFTVRRPPSRTLSVSHPLVSSE
jgi:hypothetical protein